MTLECFANGSTDDEALLPNIKSISKQILPIVVFLEFNYFKKIKNTSLRIYLVDDKELEYIDKPLKGVRTWVNYFKYFNFQEFLNLNNIQQKKQAIIKMLKEGVYEVAEEMKWDINPMLDAFNEIDNLNYQFVNTSKMKRFKGVKRYIQLETVCEPGFYHYYLLVKEKEQFISRHKVVTLNSFYNIFFEGNRILSEMKWEDENTFVVLGKKGELERIRFEYKFDTDQLTTIFNVEPNIESEFMEEYDLATTEDPKKIELILKNMDTNKWHVYI